VSENEIITIVLNFESFVSIPKSSFDAREVLWVLVSIVHDHIVGSWLIYVRK